MAVNEKLTLNFYDDLKLNIDKHLTSKNMNMGNLRICKIENSSDVGVSFIVKSNCTKADDKKAEIQKQLEVLHLALHDLKIGQKIDNYGKLYTIEGYNHEAYRKPIRVMDSFGDITHVEVSQIKRLIKANNIF